MKEPMVYLKGKFVPASAAHINIFDFGIVLGATFTDLTRTFRHVPFRLEDHVRRLYRSCLYGGIVLPITPEEMMARTNELLAMNERLIRPEEDI